MHNYYMRIRFRLKYKKGKDALNKINFTLFYRNKKFGDTLRYMNLLC